MCAFSEFFGVPVGLWEMGGLAGAAGVCWVHRVCMVSATVSLPSSQLAVAGGAGGRDAGTLVARNVSASALRSLSVFAAADGVSREELVRRMVEWYLAERQLGARRAAEAAVARAEREGLSA